MDRTQRAIDLGKVQVQMHRVDTPPVADDTRAERVALSREFSLGTVESVARVSLDWEALKERRIVAKDDALPANQAYRMLRTQVLQRARTHGLTTLGVISAMNGEGKTLTAINLALVLAAEPNQTVLLVDLDLRHPNVARTLSLNVERGLETWFGGEEPTRNVCYGVEGVERLFILPTLQSVSNSSEVLASVGTRKLFNDLKGRDPGRVLLVDLPPVLLTDDALTVAPLLDGVVLVVNERRTRREDVVRVVDLLGNTRIVGTVLNRSSESLKRAY
ncbi:MAG TPA: CpsD/CapB family tyrosine-protein kinase [Steroidobacteraceae bacterium]|nr:CpsD/CapB family tyrosine-protein kinase [Steroidobacteraceae bacterium]